MVQRVAFNTTESPVVIDDEGHAIPGLERAEVDSASAVVKQALSAGRLVWVESGEDFDLSGSAEDVLNRVGNDPDKARAALKAENASESPRTSLLTKLGRVAAQDDKDN